MRQLDCAGSRQLQECLVKAALVVTAGMLPVLHGCASTGVTAGSLVGTAPLHMDCPDYLDRTNPGLLRPGFACLDASLISPGTGARSSVRAGTMRAVERDGKVVLTSEPVR